MGAELRRRRLQTLLDLAMSYRDVNKRQFARSLGRDRSWVYRAIENPKLDLILALRDALDWSADQIADFLDLRGPEEKGLPAVDVSGLSFEEVSKLATEAYRRGEYRLSLAYAQELRSIAGNAVERATAYNIESFGWDGLGRYTKSCAAAKRGLREPGLPPSLRMVLYGNLAGSYYTLSELQPAFCLALRGLEWFKRTPARTPRERDTEAYVHYISGSTRYGLIDLEPDIAEEHAHICAAHLRRAAELYERLGEDLSRSDLCGVANTCKAGIMAAEVELGHRKADGAVAELLDGLPGPELDAVEHGDWLESYGWWCVYGANIALRHLEGRPFQQAMAIFTEKLLQIADEMENWAFRERALMFEYYRDVIISEATGYDPPAISKEQLKNIVGVIGRFPWFEEIGWKILARAEVLDHE